MALEDQQPTAVPVKLKVKRRKTAAPVVEPTDSNNASLLSSLGQGSLSALHTVGSLLSLPSRALWGTVNALSGGEGGFGNLNPIDATGGIELSHVLGDVGLIHKNDPNKWEWMDPVRGVIDIAGDPLTYVNPLTYTKKGIDLVRNAGRAAKPAAGAIDDVTEAAAKAAGPIANPAERYVSDLSRGLVPDQAIYQQHKAEIDALMASKAAAQAAPQVSPHQAIMDAISAVKDGDKGALATSRELRAATGLPKDVFDKTFMELAEKQLIQPHKHDFATSLGPDDLANLVDSGRLDMHANDGRYFVGASKSRLPVDPDLGGLFGRPAQSSQWADDGIFKSGQEAAQAAQQQIDELPDDAFRTLDPEMRGAQSEYLHDANRPGLNPTTPISREEMLDASMHPMHGMPLTEQIRQGYRGIGGVQLPFMDPLFEGFTGPKVAAFAEATRIPQALDWAGNTAPVRTLHGLFDARTRNVTHKDIQKHAIEASDRTMALNQMENQNALFDLADAEKRGLLTPENEPLVRMAMENVDPKIANPTTGVYPQDVLDLASRWKSEHLQHMRKKEMYEQAGAHIDESTGIEHFPRQVNPNAGKSSGGFLDRKIVLEGHKKGTIGINDIVEDSSIRKKLEDHFKTGRPAKDTIKQIAEIIHRKYGKGRKYTVKEKVEKLMPDGSTQMVEVSKRKRMHGPELYVDEYKHPLTGATTHVVKETGKEVPNSRISRMAKYIYEHSNATEHGLFTNSPHYDRLSYNQMSNFKHEWTRSMLDAVGTHIKREGADALMAARRSGDKTVVPLKKVMKTLKMKGGGGAFAEEIARRTGLPAEAIKNFPVKRDFVEAIERGMKTPLSQSAVPAFSDTLRSAMTMWKARTLAHPSTRARDYMSAKIQNKLMKHSTGEGTRTANELLGGKQVSGFADDPLIDMQLRRAGYAATPETETMALQAALGAGHPVNHGIIGDLPEAQAGAAASDMLQNLPGHEPRSWSKFSEDVKKIATGHTFNTMTHEWEPVRWRDMLNPLAARGAFGHEKSLNSRYALSEYLARHGDTQTRLEATLGQHSQGINLAESMRRSNQSLVNYDQNLYSDFERKLRSYVVPFYAFSSRMGKHTLNELVTNPGGLTAQAVKATGRASQGDPSAPDEVNASAAIPFKWPWLEDDGSKNYLSGFGLMHEDPINKFGHFLTGDIREGMRGLGGSVGPFYKPAIEQMTGRSLFTGGDIDNLDPGIGRTLSNIGVATGLYRDENGKPVDWEDARPVKLPAGVESLVGYSPFSRDAATVRMLTDVRPSKSILDKALQLSTGYRTTSITPERQQKVLRQRLEKAAKGLGAREISNVSFSPEQMESIRKRDPETADNLEHLQAIIRSINKSSRDKKKAKASTKEKR